MTTYDAAFKEVMGRQVGDTDLKNLDLYLLGEAVLNIVGTCHVLGHKSPAHTLDYQAQPTEYDHVSQHILRDLLAWVSGRKSLAPDCDERLLGWIADEWAPHQMAKVGRRIGAVL